MTDSKIDISSSPSVINNVIEWNGSSYSSIPDIHGYKQGDKVILNLNCEDRDCGKTQTPYLDPATNTVHCSICDEEMTNISPFMKNMLRQNQMFRTRPKKPFAVKCECGREDTPELDENDNLVCSKCSKPLKLTVAYATMLKAKLANSD